MTKIVISGYFGYENIGDEAILLSMVNSFKKEYKSLKITVLSAKPEVTARRYQVNAIYRYDFKKIFKSIYSCDLFISGGGSLLQDITSWRTIPYYLSLVFIAQLLGKKTVFYAQGIGPVKSLLNKRLIKWIGNKADLITVRDTDSYSLLIDLGINSKIVRKTVDPVFCLREDQNNKLNMLNIKSRHQELEKVIRTEKPLIGVSVRPWNDNKYLSQIAKSLDYFVGLTGGKVVIVPMHFYQDQDLSVLLKNQLKSESIILREQYTPAEILGLFSEFDFFLGIRLHALIFAAINNIPLVGISYDPKVSSFLQSLGLNSKISIKNCKSSLLNDVLKDVWNNKEYFSDNISKQVDVLHDKAKFHVKTVLELV